MDERHPLPDQPLPPNPAMRPVRRDVSTNQVPEENTQNTVRNKPVIHQEQQSPIVDAVHTAVDQAPTTHQLDPELVKQLTEQVTERVLKSLQAANLTAIASSEGPGRAASAPMTSAERSIKTPDTAVHQGYTSESWSSEASDWRDDSCRDSPSNSPVRRYESGDKIKRHRTQSFARGNTGDAQAQRRPSLATARQNTAPMQSPPSTSLDSTATDDRTTRPPLRKDSGDPEGIFQRDGDAARKRASTQSRRREHNETLESPDSDEPTTLEKVWQPLFDNGIPTARAGQFLRGIAKHIIHDFDPKDSLVVTPAKMMAFFEETKLPVEHYPWTTIFGGKMSATNLSKMYQKLLCQHHLVQTSNHETPFMPALTAQGFEMFMSCLIQAHPDSEYERLTLALKNMPICNGDDKRERFPKELPRRLLPKHANVQAEQRLIASLNHEPLISLARGATAMPPPPPQPSASTPRPSFNEREKGPYSTSAARSGALDDSDISPPSLPLERERKPYFAKEGGGKQYAGDYDREKSYERESTRSVPSESRSEPVPSRAARSNSSFVPQVPQDKFPPPLDSSPGINPSASWSRSQLERPPYATPASGQPSNYQGRRSSPGRAPYTRSDPTNLSEIPSSQFASTLRSTHVDEDSSRPTVRRQSEHQAFHPGEDDTHTRGFPIPQRTVPPKPTYTSGFPAAPPATSFGGRAPDPTSYDARRRTPGFVSGSVSGPGGTDGYGSFGASPPANIYGSTAPH